MSDNLPAPVPSSRLTDRMTYAKALAAASLLPSQYRGQPANVLLAMEYGDALGLSAIAAIQGVNVIDGKPTASAQLIGALVRRAGHRLRVETSPDGTSARATIIRADDPDFPFTCTWTMERATAAGLAGKGAWRTYPEAMLKARAITEVARDACPEVLSGVAYTPEELGAEETAAYPAATWDVPPPAPDGVDTDTGEIVDAELVEDTAADEAPESPTLPARPDMPAYLPGPAGRAQAQPGSATDTQVRKLAKLMADQHITHHVLAEFTAERLKFTMPDTLEGLDKAQASAIITALTEVKA
jgi:hypothetical protein